MNRIIPLLYLLMIFTGCSADNGNDGSSNKITFTEDTQSLLRNPCVGWGVYDDAAGAVANAENYWTLQDEPARKYASFFYVRWRWSEMEPEEGKYAWIYDDNYKKLIQGALDRGLKLCFRIYDNGQDNLNPGTPDYVRQAGAKGYTVSGGGKDHWTPYPDDPVFQEKLTKFVQAFAREYDNADVVDFVDGYCLGWWGECHHIELLDPSGFVDVFDWYTTLYSSNFKNIILALPFGSQIGFPTEKRIAIEGKGYAMRRDGLGSMWFTDEEKRITGEMFGKTLFIGESCWWGCTTDDCTPFASDTKYDLKTWRDVYELTFEHALENHFNTLDLRTPTETQGWTTRAADLVQQFISEGGYRISPVSVYLPEEISNGTNIIIHHSWKNNGNGYLPNNNPNWNYKYKPAFALMNTSGEVVKTWVDEDAEPSQWFKGDVYEYSLNIQVKDVVPGEYTWVVSIVNNKKDNTPGIRLAVKDNDVKDGWVILDTVIIN